MTTDPSTVVGGIAVSPRMLRSGLVPLSMSEALRLGLGVAPLELACRRPTRAPTRALWRPTALVLEVFRLGGIVGDLDAFDLRREDNALVASPAARVGAPGERGVWTSMRKLEVVSDAARELAESAQRISDDIAVTAALSRAEVVLGPTDHAAVALLHLRSRLSRRTLTVPEHAGVLEVALAGALTWAAAANVVALEVVLPPSTWGLARRLMRRLAPLASGSMAPEAVRFRHPAGATRMRPRAGTLVVVPWAEQVTSRLGDRLLRALDRWPAWLLVDHEPPSTPRFVARLQHAGIESVEHLALATPATDTPQVRVLQHEESAYRDLLPSLRSRLPPNVSQDALVQLAAGPEWVDGVFSTTGVTVPPELADRLDRLVPSSKLVAEAEACRRATQEGRGRRVVASQSRPLALLRELLLAEGIDVSPIELDVRLAAHAVTVGPTGVGWSWAILDTAWTPEARQVMEIARVGGDWHAGSPGERAGVAAMLDLTDRAARAQVDPAALLAGHPGGVRRWRASLLASLVDGQPPEVSWLPRAVEHARHRARRVAVVDLQSSTVEAEAPARPAAPRDLSRAVAEIQQMLRERGVEVQRLPNGSFVVTASRPGAGLSVGTVLLLDRAGEGADVDLRPTSPAGSLLLHDVGRPALSIDVPALPAATDLPTTDHVDGLRLVSREYRMASVEVVGQARAGDVSGVHVEPYRHGTAVRTGRPRRTLAKAERGGLPGAEAVSELATLLRTVESDLLERENRRVLSARVVVGDDVTVIETWDGPAGRAEVMCDLTADATSLIHRDSRGERVRTLDMCGGTHLTDASWCRTCVACGTRRCPTCPDGATLRSCMICGTPACGSCRAEGPCARCRSARPAPSLDTAEEVGWHLGEAELRLGPRHAWLRRAGDRDWTLLAPDGDADNVVYARMRGVSHAAGRGVGTQYRVADPPSVRDPAPSVLFARDRSVVTWEESGGDVERRDLRPADVIELPAAQDLPAREEGAYRLGQLLTQLRERRPPPAAPDVIGFSELERTEVRLQDGRLWEVVVSHRHGRRAREVSRVEVPLAPPVTPRHDADGDLLLQGRRHGLVVEVIGVNASHLLRLDDNGDVRELFRSRRRTPTAASELGWHRLALAHGLPPGAAVVKEAGAMERRASVGDAVGVGATRTEQHVTPRPVFRRVDGDHRMVTARDLRLLDREGAYSGAKPMGDGLAQEFDRLVDHYLAAPTTRFAVDVVWHVEETWVGRSKADVVYVVQGSAPTWPPLDETGQPGECVSVNSFSHLHAPSDTWSCEACDRWYCRGCGDAGLFSSCRRCGRPTCPDCLDAPTRPVGSGTCERCGIASCAECGRNPETVRCLVCRRELCRSCSPYDVCVTCAALQPIDTTAVRLPDELAASGCTVWSASDEDADVIMIRGRGRREIALLRDGRVSVWMTLETPGETNLQILLARATGVHCDLPDLHPPVQGDGLAVGRTVSARVVLPTGLSWTVVAGDLDLRTRLTSVLDDGRGLPVEASGSSDLSWPPPPAEAWQAVRPQPPLRLVAVTDDGAVCKNPAGRLLTITWSERHGAHSWYGRRLLAHVEGARLEVYVTGGDVRLAMEAEDGRRRYVLLHDSQGLVDRAIARVLERSEAAVDVVGIADPTMTAGLDGVSIDRTFRPVAHVVPGGAPMGSNEVATALGARPEVEGEWATLPEEARPQVAVSSGGSDRPSVAVAWEVTEQLQAEAGPQTVIYQLVPTETGTRVLTTAGIWDSRAGSAE